MKYLKFSIKTKTYFASLICDIIFKNNIVGALIEDNENLYEKELKEMYVDIPLQKNDDGIAYISFFVHIYKNQEELKNFNNIDSRKDKNIIDYSYKNSNDNFYTEEEYIEIINNIKNDISEYQDIFNMGEVLYSEKEIEDEDYLNKWKEYFHQFEVDGVIIKPSWEEVNVNYDGIKTVINIDPGAAFGTGTHATTKLCIKQIIKYIESSSDANNMNFLDIGCGSGILGIVANKLGIKNTTNIDIDSSIEMTLIDNLEKNNIKKDEFNYAFGNVLEDNDLFNNLNNKKYNIVVANILAPVIISLVTKINIHELISDDGVLILSGIIKNKEDEVKNAINSNEHLEIIHCTYEDDWVCITVKKK